MATIKRTTEKFWKVYGEKQNKTKQLFCTVGENETWYSHHRKQNADSSKNWVVVQRKQKQKLEKLYEPPCLLHHFL